LFQKNTNAGRIIEFAATRYDLDTLNAIHVHRRTRPQIYEAQA